MMDGLSEAGDADVGDEFALVVGRQEITVLPRYPGITLLVPEKGVQGSHVNPLCNSLYLSPGGSRGRRTRLR